jgi:hypothetical protein
MKVPNSITASVPFTYSISLQGFSMWQFSEFRVPHFIFGAGTEHKTRCWKKQTQGKVNFHVRGNLIRSLWDQDHPLPPYAESRRPEFKLTSTYLTETCARVPGSIVKAADRNSPTRSTYFEVLVYVFTYGQNLRLRSVWFRSRTGYQISRLGLSWLFHAPTYKMTEQFLEFGHDHFLPHPFLFTTHSSPCYSTLHGLR